MDNKYWNVTKSYFTENEWEKLDDRDQKACVLIYEIYKTLLDAGFPSEKPSFVKKYDSRISRINSNEVIQSTNILQPEDTIKQESEAVANLETSIITSNSNNSITTDCNFDTTQHLERRKKTQEKFLECKICDKKFIRKGNLKRHISTVHNNKDVQMGELKHRTNTISCKNNSQKTLKEELKTFKCFYCKYRTSYKNCLTAHINSIHFNIKYVCGHCNYSTAYKNSLKNHIDAIHLNIQRYECQYCKYKTTQRQCLVNHVNVDHLKRKLKCKQCNFSTAFDQSLYVHIKTVHFKTRNYKCKYCDYSTVSKKSLTVHINAVHLNINKRCEYCDYTASTKQNLNVHIDAVHLKIKKFECSYCYRKFSQKCGLDGHIYRIHLKIKNKN